MRATSGEDDGIRGELRARAPVLCQRASPLVSLRVPEWMCDEK